MWTGSQKKQCLHYLQILRLIIHGKPFKSFFNSIAKIAKGLSSPSCTEKSCNHDMKDGKNAIP